MSSGIPSSLASSVDRSYGHMAYKLLCFLILTGCYSGLPITYVGEKPRLKLCLFSLASSREEPQRNSNPSNSQFTAKTVQSQGMPGTLGVYCLFSFLYYFLPFWLFSFAHILPFFSTLGILFLFQEQWDLSESQFYTHNESLSPYYYKQEVRGDTWDRSHNKFISHFQQ